MELNDLKQLIREAILSESLTDKLYHFTYFDNLLNILKENKFHASTNIGSSADLNTSAGKFFFFSMTRSKQSGFKRDDVKIVMNGRLLSQKYKAVNTDYWQYSKNPKDYPDKNSYIRALSRSEQEERIVLNEPTINNASKYILEIHILLSEITLQYDTKEDVDYLISYSKENNMPIYFYDNAKYFYNETKNKTINPLELKLNKKDVQQEYKRPPLYFINRVAALLSYNNNDNFNKIINGLNLQEDTDSINELKKQIQKDAEYYLKYPDKFQMQEYYSVVSSEIHNNRTEPDNAVRFIMKMLADDMRKNKVSNLKSYIYKKADYNPDKTKF